MLLTIDRIKQLKQQGKNKWGKALANYLKPHFDNNERLDAIQELLVSEYGIEMSLTNLQKLKSNHYNKPKKIAKFEQNKTKQSSHTEEQKTSNTVQQDFVQKQGNNVSLGSSPLDGNKLSDKPLDNVAETAYQQIYGHKKKNDFDLEGL